jgi:superfamily II DNA or RNA helicase
MKIGKERKNPAIILNIDMLSEGIDLPEINGVIICRAIDENTTKLLQIVGRSVRRDDYDRQFVEDVSIKWNEYHKFRKPVSYVYIPTVVNSESEMEGVIKVLENIYDAYGDLNFTTTVVENSDGESKAVVKNGKQLNKLSEEEKQTGRISKLKHKLLEMSLMGLCKSDEVKYEIVSNAINALYERAKETGDTTQLKKLAEYSDGTLNFADRLNMYGHIVKDSKEEMVVV